MAILKSKIFLKKSPGSKCGFKIKPIKIINELPFNRKVVNSPEKRNTKKTNISYCFVTKSQGFTTVLGIGKK